MNPTLINDRIAATFDSPRCEEDKTDQLFKQLRAVSVVETASLSRTFSITQDKKRISVAAESGNMHITETANSMTVFVPRGKKAQRVCFSSQLPKAYAEWLMLNPTNNRQGVVASDMINTLMYIFACPASAAEIILDNNGIFKPSSFSGNYDDSETEDEDSDEDSTASRATTPNTELGSVQRYDMPGFSGAISLGYSVSERSQTVGREVYSSARRNSSQTLVAVERASSSISQQRRLPSPIAPVQQTTVAQPVGVFNSRSSMSPYLGDGQDGNGQYERLLQQVVDHGRRAEFPQIGSFNMTALADALPFGSDSAEIESYDGADVNIRTGSMSQLERDKRVGAAGELYVS